jgi:dCTP deaminase
VSTLTRARLEARLRGEDKLEPLVVTPILTTDQVGESSIDVRLGNQFIVFRMHAFGVYSLGNASTEFRQWQERQVLRFRNAFILHPGTLALASTFEYVRMPGDLECQVEGRSSWARVGIQVATASTVQPGFMGVITLELSNVGTIPIEMYPGERIAQLVFRDALPPVPPGSYGPNRKYRCAVGPEFSRLHIDTDSLAFRPQKK